MPKKQPQKRAKKGFDVSVVENELDTYHKDKQLQVVDRLCRLNLTAEASLTDTAKAILTRAQHADLNERKQLAVLARRLHDRFPRCDAVLLACLLMAACAKPEQNTRALSCSASWHPCREDGIHIML